MGRNGYFPTRRKSGSIIRDEEIQQGNKKALKFFDNSFCIQQEQFLFLES